MLSQLEVAYKIILKDSSSKQTCSFVSSNPFAAVEYTTAQAEAVVIGCVCILVEIGNAKSNLIGVNKRFLSSYFKLLE